MRDYQLPSEVAYDALNVEELIHIILSGNEELRRLAFPESHNAAWAVEQAALAIGHRLFYTKNKPDEWC